MESIELNAAFGRGMAAASCPIKGGPYLLAVSGGPDSVCLALLLKQAGASFAMVHFNHGLRRRESDADAEFVQKLAQQLDCRLFLESSEAGLLEKDGGSLQAKARDWRYERLESIRSANGFEAILTAHHAEDQLETILLNFIRGAALSGLRGMQHRRGKIARPLLHISKADLLGELKRRGWEYRLDSSNAEDKYRRNLLRNKLIPLMEEINPGLLGTWLRNADLLEQTRSYLKRSLHQSFEAHWESRGSEYWMPIRLWKQHPDADYLLGSWLNEWGFNADQIAEVKNNLVKADSEPREWHSAGRRIIRYRKFLISAMRTPEVAAWTLLVDEDCPGLNLPAYELRIRRIPIEKHRLKKDPLIVQLDADKLKFPLVLRLRREGDYLHLLGDKRRKKKLKEILNEAGLAPHERERIPVLESDGRICALIGHRLDQRFCLDGNSRRVFQMEFRKTDQ